MQILATYNAYSVFNIPTGIILLTDDELEMADELCVGYWYIRWNILYYIDKDGKQKQIVGTIPDVDTKRIAGYDITI